ncbi:MAG: prepilin-type N-terminal cleavage/methylation domain-containing protein [Phycisphaeraceae bacterium]|nr:prepilin-type N-terminal cleavage/methylation domain-containing protein [Phycisphaeraceae bacterium]
MTWAVRPGRGVTLVELMVALAMASTVMIGAVAAVGIAGRSFRSATDGTRSERAIDALDRVAADVQLAIRFHERTPLAVAFDVPDRTGNGAPERIRYAWSGTPGDPLTYSMNGSAPEAILPGVRGLSLSYVVATVQGQSDWVSEAQAVPSDELIFAREATGAIADRHTLGPSASIAAIIRPVLTSGSRYRVTRVRIPMVGNPGGSDVVVSLHRVNMLTGTPDATVLASYLISQQSMPAALAPVEADLLVALEFNSGDHIAIVVSQGAGGSAAAIPLEPSPQFLADGWIATTSLLGLWTINGTRDMPIEIYAQIDPEL